MRSDEPPEPFGDSGHYRNFGDEYPFGEQPTQPLTDSRGGAMPGGSWPSDAPTLVRSLANRARSYQSAWGDDSAPDQRSKSRTHRRGLSRRSLLVGAGAGAVGIGALGAGVGVFLSNRAQGTAAGDVFSEQAGQIAHLLRRAGFGPSPYDIAEYLNLGVAGATDRLLNYGAVHDDLDQRLSAMTFNPSSADDLIRWFVLRMIYSKRPLEEKMTLFWSGVLTSSFQKVTFKRGHDALMQQNNVLRQKGMGRFDDLIHAITVDPAMLLYLDGNQSTGHNPNENYARELMELFTMGVGNYTQDDVHQGALALTGWAVSDAGQAVYHPLRHFTGAVTYLGHTGTMGVDDVVRLVCAHPATGHHIAWRMWSFFVYENPSDADLQPLVDAYYHSNHSIAAMVQAMLTAPAFYSDKAYRARVKSPLEFAAGALRGLGVDTDGAGARQILSAMGQTPFDPPDVSGWDGDKVSAAWVSTQTWMNRINFINSLLAAASGLPAGQTSLRPSQAGNVAHSPLQQLITAQRIGSTKALVDYFVAALVDNRLPNDRRAILYDAVNVTAPQGPAFALAKGVQVPAMAVRQMLYLLMSTPEYQMN
jgi:Protein of unknown function (DUF1800)